MPILEHLAILDQGVDSWNKWRENNPDIIPDLSSADLEGEVLKNINLRRANLKETNFIGADLENADFFKAELVKADLTETTLTNANLWAANLTDATLTGTNLREGKLMSADLSGANLVGAKLLKGILTEANLSGANLSSAKVQSADLYKANLSGATLRWTDFTNAHIRAIKYDNKTTCQSTNVTDCKDNQRFIRHVMDLNYIEETKENYIWKYRFWKLTSNCGQSIWRWALLSILLAGIFGILFADYPVWEWLPDGIKNVLISIDPKMGFNDKMIVNGFTPYYFSIVTFTTLGFGDVTPLNLAGQVWLTLEVVVGYIMLGGLITLFATKMTRQSS